MIIINDNCDWSWSEWDKALIEVVLEHANIRAEEIYVEDMDYEEIYLRVKELDISSTEHIVNHYTIRYFEDTIICGCFMFAYFFYRSNGVDMTMIDNGAYQIKRVNGILKSLRLVD